MGLVERNAFGHEFSAHLGLQLGVGMFVLGLVLVHERVKLVRNGSGCWNSGWPDQGPLLFRRGRFFSLSLSQLKVVAAEAGGEPLPVFSSRLENRNVSRVQLEDAARRQPRRLWASPLTKERQPRWIVSCSGSRC